MKNTFTFYAKILSLHVFILFIFGIPLSAQDSIFADPVVNPFGLSAPGGDTVSRVILADLDHDGIMEAFIHSVKNDPPDYSWRDLKYYLNTGSNDAPSFVFEESFPFEMPNTGENWLWQLADINGDGKEDFVANYFALGKPVAILLNNGSSEEPLFSGSFMYNPYGITLPISDINGDILDAVTPTFVDITGDGKLDLFYGGVFANSIFDEAFYFSENTGTLTEPLYAAPEKNPFGLSFPVGIGLHYEKFGDIDCDGDFDLYFLGLGAGPNLILLFFENTGTPTSPDFSQPGEITDIFGAHGSFIDIGGDDDLDLIAGSGGEGILYYENLSECEVSSTELYLDAVLKLSPNPASDFLTFELVSNESLVQVEIELLNMMGQKVTTVSAQAINNTLQKTISLKDLTPGVYLLKVNSSNRFLAHKFLKL